MFTNTSLRHVYIRELMCFSWGVGEHSFISVRVNYDTEQVAKKVA